MHRADFVVNIKQAKIAIHTIYHARSVKIFLSGIIGLIIALLS